MSTPSSTSDAGSHLLVPGQHAEVVQRLKNVPGYSTPVFKGKEEQRAKVQANVAAKVCSRSDVAACAPQIPSVSRRSFEGTHSVLLWLGHILAPYVFSLR